MSQENRNETTKVAPAGSAAQDGRKKLRWALLSLVIAALSVWAVTSQWKGFSLKDFANYVSRADLRWMAAATVSMLGFIFFEALALRSACRALKYPCTVRHGMSYAAADIYFSAITPSASGGQPACALMMMRDGIPGIVATAVLLMTLSMYALALLTITILAFIVRPGVFFTFEVPSRILIVVGFLLQAGLAFFFLLLVKSEKLLESICAWGLRVLSKLRIVRHLDKRAAKLQVMMEEYRQCSALLTGHWGMLARSFAFNFMQRVSQIAVTMLVYLAMGGRLRLAANVFAMQSFVVVGSNCIPVPGAMGVADYLMLDGFNAYLPHNQVIAMELLCRSLSFYSCVLICAVIFVFSSVLKRRCTNR